MPEGSITGPKQTLPAFSLVTWKKLRSIGFYCAAIFTLSLTQTVINKKDKISLQHLTSQQKLETLPSNNTCIQSAYMNANFLKFLRKKHILSHPKRGLDTYEWSPLNDVPKNKGANGFILAYHSRETLTRKMHQALYFQH